MQLQVVCSHVSFSLPENNSKVMIYFSAIMWRDCRPLIIYTNLYTTKQDMLQLIIAHNVIIGDHTVNI